MTKGIVSLGDTPKRIKHIKFGALSPQEILQLAEIEVCARELYNVADRSPAQHGTLDRRLGVSDKNNHCETCGQKLADCAGHFGVIRLELPVFHIGYFKATIQILQSICKTCSAVLLTVEQKEQYLRRLRNPVMENLQRQAIVKAIIDSCKKVVYCPHCSATNGTVKKVGSLKIIHEKYRAKKTSDEAERFRQTFASAVSENAELKTHIGKAQDDLNPLKVLELFEAMSSDDVELLSMDPDGGRPERYIWRHVPVPPVAIRPSVAMSSENGSNEDDLTVKLSEIVYANLIIKDNLEKGASIQMIMEDWDFLQLQCAMYVNSDLPGVQSPMAMQSKPIRGICQRLKGKTGRFRGNLSGKRVDFSSRTVISPDPNLSIEQVAVPVYVAKTMTYPEVVFEHNIEKLRRCVINGPDKHPGANFVVQHDGMKRYLKFGNRELIAKNLRIGETVERHLTDGDIVLFNRQPSLHKLSIMAHIAKVCPWRTFRFNECVCNPYNADFDGDEMNMHLPQTEEARAEAMELMGVRNNLVTPRNGMPLIAAIQDFITAAYLLTCKDVFYDRAQFSQACSFLHFAELHIELPPPAIQRPVQLWTGKQVIQVLLRPTLKDKTLINLETKGRTATKTPAGYAPDMCPCDGYLVIRNSEIMCGRLDKSTIGEGNKGSVFYVLMRDYGPPAAVKCMNRLAKLCARWLAIRGFSIGINDVTPGEQLRTQKDALVEKAYQECDALIDEYKAGRLQTQPGCTPEQTLEAEISGKLSRVRDDVGQICLQELSPYNAPLIMQWCGSKGSKINVSQMVACVGQQIISGQRIPDGFTDRSLPHFAPKSRIPPAKGFVRNSFYSGLTPTEFFFHAVSGREGLVDTAVKTAETGYMQRRLMKALEDLSTQYDLSVRNSIGGVVQFCYGDDGLDPASMEGDDQPVHFMRNLQHCKALLCDDKERGLLPDEVQQCVQEHVQKMTTICSDGFLDTVKQFFTTQVLEPMQTSIQRHSNVLSAQDICNHLGKVTRPQLDQFFSIILNKYLKAKIEPGTAVGALGAQSIGEPGTQMTLKTFHFAGVASMNVTLGVPRIKEIINASKTISTPIIHAKLDKSDNVTSARIVKGRVEKTLLGDIAEHISEVHHADDSYLLVKLDMQAIQSLQLELDVHAVRSAILRAPKLKLQERHVYVREPDTLRVLVPEKEGKEAFYYQFKALKRALPQIIVLGIPTVSRAVINMAEDDGKYELAVEGQGLRQVMSIPGVNGLRTTSNHIMEIEKVLGIEAARSTIIHEIQYTMSKHGMTIDMRHVMLLADIMTYKGQLLGITRFGIAKMKDSVLMLASFEKTTDHLFDAALLSKRDDIDGVSECIIMGAPMPVGTGLFKLMQRVDRKNELKKESFSVAFDRPELHVPLPKK